MLFHCPMVSTSGIFHDGSSSGKNGIAIMLDSMRLFQSDEVLQAMSCWSLVNVALAPSQKAVLVKLGGISNSRLSILAAFLRAGVTWSAAKDEDSNRFLAHASKSRKKYWCMKHRS
jgi:hypothetical protein